MIPFTPFPKIGRWLNTKVAITEKIDGTNGLIDIMRCSPTGFADDPTVLARAPANDLDDYVLRAGSRSRWLTPGKTGDNFGFAHWVQEHARELLKLGEGAHYGEWWGAGIQRRYGLTEGDKRFSLFNVGRWAKVAAGVSDTPAVPGEGSPTFIDAPGLAVVPTLYYGTLQNAGQDMVAATMDRLKFAGSQAAPGFKDPEGVMIYFESLKQYAKAPFDPAHKG